MLPSAVLVGVGLRVIAQERELAETRVADEWLRAVGQIRQDLLSRLERIKLEELGALTSKSEPVRARAYVNPEVQLVATVEDGRIVLPWEANGAQIAGSRLSDVVFADWMQQGERAEFQRQDYRTAIESYGRAIEIAQHPVQSGYARLSLARVLADAGRDQESRAQYRQVFALPTIITDEHGMPLALYAAVRLLDARLDQRQILGRLRAEIDNPEWMAPGTTHMLCGLLTTLTETASDSSVARSAGDLWNPIADRIPATELALALQRDFPRLGLRYPTLSDNANASRWISFGDGEWLVSAGALPEEPRETVIAVNAHAMFAPLQDADLWPGGQIGEVRALTSGDGNGQLLGASLPGLEVVFPSSADDTSMAGTQRSLYGIALLLVLTITFFGAYLVWRDVRRELRLADSRSQFVSSVSHELKTPLTSIRMFAETLQTKDAPDAQMRTDYLGTIVGESERLTRLLNNVLDLSKIEQDRMIYRRHHTSLAEVTRRAARAMEYPLEQEGFTLNVDCQDRLPPVSVDPDALEQAILNLLTNAMKYSGDSREIDLRLGTENGHGVIEVTDRGMGIAPHELEHLTETFYRVPSPENQLVPGTGLGLTLVEHMARAHGGDLRVRSVVGEGSTFTIRLPLEGAA
jgi:signal transduction histidine kinase